MDQDRASSVTLSAWWTQAAVRPPSFTYVLPLPLRMPMRLPERAI